MKSVIRKILSSGLNFKVASIVLASIVFVEVVILVPSFFAEKQRKITAAEHQAQLLISTLTLSLQYENQVENPDFYARQLGGHDLVKGYVICNKLECPVAFGETVNPFNASNTKPKVTLSSDETRLDTTQKLEADSDAYWITLRTDTFDLQKELFHYVLKVFFLVTLICLFVAVTTTVGLMWIVVYPVKSLINNIQNLLEDPDNPLNYVQEERSFDEIGDLTKTINRLLLNINNYQKRALETQKEAEEGLSASEARWKFALEGSGDGVWDWNPVTDQAFFSNQFLDFLGYAEGEFITKMSDWPPFVHPEDISALFAAMQSHLEGETKVYSFEHRIKHKRGHWVWSLSRGMVVSRDEDGLANRVVGTFTDITKHKETEALIWRQANVDLLTGLPNRRQFQAHLQDVIDQYQREKTGDVVLMLLDLDNFKIINDTHSHQHGDSLLKEAAQRLNACVNDKGIAARLGGDEFTVVLTNITQKSDVADIAQRILMAIARPFVVNFETFHVSASIGITDYPNDANDIDELIMNADQAMYNSKELGRNCYSYFSYEMRTVAQQRMRSINELHEALHEEQFEIFYQPIIDFKTGFIVKAESLIRWNHPTKGLVGADNIIPLAEETGLIVDIGNWVFKQSVTQLAKWRNTHSPHLQLSINTSPAQYQHDDCVVSEWYELMDKLKLPYNCLVVEITESIMLDFNGRVNGKLEAFRKGGVQLALDDFGTGYSSLSYLKDLNSHYLKIDQSFVRNIVENNESKALCLEIIKFAHIFNMKIIAEGIETQGQADLLLKGGCNFGQGFFYSKPLPAHQFDALLRVKRHGIDSTLPAIETGNLNGNTESLRELV